MLDEFLAYVEQPSGLPKPLVAVCKYDGDLQYREILREDLIRVHDDYSVPGGWVFIKGCLISTHSNCYLARFSIDNANENKWSRKFICLRGPFIFVFLSPNTEQPTAVIPLLDVDIVVPEDGNKLFEDRRLFKANEGFEFDVRPNGLERCTLLCTCNRWIAFRV
jgi:hypothetical protein